MTAPEAYIHYSPGLIDDDGRVTTPGTEEFLRQFMAAFAEYTARVLTVIPQA
jgi:chromate reductase